MTSVFNIKTHTHVLLLYLRKQTAYKYLKMWTDKEDLMWFDIGLF
jgi:hypothetical protein